MLALAKADTHGEQLFWAVDLIPTEFMSGLSEEQIDQAWNALIGILEAPTDTGDRYLLGKVAERLLELTALDPDRRNERIAEAYLSFARMLQKSEESDFIYDAVQVLHFDFPSGQKVQLTPAEREEVWRTLVSCLRKGDLGYPFQFVLRMLKAHAARFSVSQVSGLGDEFITELKNADSYGSLSAGGTALASLAPSLEEPQLTQAHAALITVLQRTYGEDAVAAAKSGLTALAPKLSREDAVITWTEITPVLERTDIADYGWNGGQLGAAANTLAAFAPQTNPDQVFAAWKILITKLPHYSGNFASEAFGKPLTTFATELADEQVEQAWDSLLLALKQIQPPKKDVCEAAVDGLVAVFSRLSESQQATVVEDIRKGIQERYGIHMTKLLPNLSAVLEPSVYDELSASVLGTMLNHVALGQISVEDSRQNARRQPIVHSILAMSNARSVATLLSHPACTDEPREWMLMRFEELLFHDGRHVLLTLPESDEDSDEETSTNDNAKPEPPARRFHTIYDAAEWIQANWPDFDLDATPEVQWR